MSEKEKKAPEKKEKKETEKKGKKETDKKKETKDSKSEEQKRLTENDLVPSELRKYVSQEVWNMWSPIRRQTLQSIIKNPNTFFYRNRPPGDPQKTGPFTPEEEEQFRDRLRYFREELEIEDGLWGLFSVPIRGRLGYQCSNFYRLLIKDGKLTDDKYQLEDGKLVFKHGNKKPIPPNSIKILEQEAFAFIEECLKTEGDGTPQMEKPVRNIPATTRTNKNKDKKNTSNEDKDTLKEAVGRARRLADRHFNALEEQVKISGAKGGGMTRKRKSFIDDDDFTGCPLIGAPDPLTGEPIKVPMMDDTGYVLDIQTWREIFKENIIPPRPIYINSENDLIEITNRNFKSYRLQVTNIPC